MHDLGTLGGRDSAAYAINNAGQITGRSHLSGNLAEHAFLWEPAPGGPPGAGSRRSLGTLGGTSSVGHGINSKGDVVGFAHIQGNAARAFVYVYAENTMYRLGHLIPSGSGWTLEIAYGINDRGQIVGRGIYGGRIRAFLLTLVNTAPTVSCPAPATVPAISPGSVAHTLSFDVYDVDGNALTVDGFGPSAIQHADVSGGVPPPTLASVPFVWTFSLDACEFVKTYLVGAVVDRGAFENNSRKGRGVGLSRGLSQWRSHTG